MPFFPRPKEEIAAANIKLLNENTNLTQLTPGAKARFFIDAIASEQGRQYSVFNLNLVQAYLQYADGKFLDLFGDLFNLPRLESINAETEDDNFLFYVDSGNFGAINNGSGFVVKSGTSIFSPQYSGSIVTPGLSATNDHTYVVTQDVNCEAGSSFAYAKIRATKEGRAGNIPRNVLIGHNFVSYAMSSSRVLKCTNRFPIDSGDDRETDGAYRYRLMQVIKSKEKATRAAIYLAALSVPGVSNVNIVSCEQGPGSISVYVLGTAPTTSPKLIEKVTTSVGAVTSDGVRLFVLGPRPIGLEFLIGLNWSPRATEEEKNIDKGNIRTAIERELRGLGMGDSLDLQRVILSILNNSSYVLSIGKAEPNKFEDVYIYRSVTDGVGYTRTRLLADVISPLYNEKIILETSNAYQGIQFV
jgi:uncharacterized phage protein gp47/JayE